MTWFERTTSKNASSKGSVVLSVRTKRKPSVTSRESRMSTPQTAPVGPTYSAKRAAMTPEPTPISRQVAPETPRSRTRIALIFSAFSSRDGASRDSCPARGGPSGATLLPRERQQGQRHLPEAPDLDLDGVEGGEHLTERVLGEAPVVSRLVVIRVEMRHSDHGGPTRLERTMHAAHGVFDLEDVFQHVEAEDDVERVLEGHRSNVDDLVPELRDHIGLNELGGRIEDGPKGEGLLAQIVTPASDLEDPLAGHSGGELLQVAADPRSGAEEEVDDRSEGRLQPVSVAQHRSAADRMSSTNRAPRASTLQSSARRLAPSSSAERNASSESTPSIARASSAGSPGVTSTPLRPSSTASSIPAKREATIARLAAIASRRTMGTPSWSPEAAVTDGTTKTSASRSARPRSWRPTCPRKRTGRPSAAASRRSRQGPSPMTSSDQELARRRRTASRRTWKPFFSTSRPATRMRPRTGSTPRPAARIVSTSVPGASTCVRSGGAPSSSSRARISRFMVVMAAARRRTDA